MHVSSLADMAASPEDINAVGCTTCGDMQVVKRVGVAGLTDSVSLQRIAVIAAVAAVIYFSS